VKGGQDVTGKTLHIPLASADPQFDADSPDYRGGNPATYLIFAFCYDSIGAPSASLQNGVAVPDYARMQWRLAEARPDSDFRTWRIEVRSGVTSTAGAELSAADVKWSLTRALSLGAMGAWRWRDVAGIDSAEDIEVLDGKSVRLKLRAPNPHLDAYLFSAAPLLFDSATASAHATDADPWSRAWLASGGTAGFAGYELQDRDDRTMRFGVRGAGSEDAQVLAAAVVEQVTTRAEGLSYLTTRDPAYVIGVRCDEAAALRGHSGVRMTISRGGHTSVELNYHRPPFDDRRVRHALSLATPYEEVIDRGFLGLARPWHGPLPTYDRWQTRGSWPYATNQQAARELLRKAGYAQGFEAALYLPGRPDATRIGEILQAAYAPLGIALTLRDMRELPDGWIPPMYLRMECGHNFNEPVYDIAHDYVPVNGLTASSPVKEGIGTWFPRYPGSRALESLYRKVLTAETADQRRSYCLSLQRAIVSFAPCIFLAENLQINASTESVSGWAADYKRRVTQVLQFQNCNTGYLPSA
jgi:ABC-type transport system substrate-binding protein